VRANAARVDIVLIDLPIFTVEDAELEAARVDNDVITDRNLLFGGVDGVATVVASGCELRVFIVLMIFLFRCSFVDVFATEQRGQEPD